MSTRNDEPFMPLPTMAKADLPFGGVRGSGYGRELPGLGINAFVNHKLIDVVGIERCSGSRTAAG